MQLTLLKGKIHRATVTEANQDYEGSCRIDTALLRASGIREYEQIEIYNLDNGERFTTYTMRGEAGSGVISMNGAAAHKAKVGDRIIVCAYATMSETEAEQHQPGIVLLDADNRIREARGGLPHQAA